MTSKEEMINKYLIAISKNIDISQEMREKAEMSYRAVGRWLGDCDVDSDVKIMPQGSFNLGTVVRPISDKDEYDIDLVCLLKNAKDKSEKEIKQIVGNRLNEHGTYKEMLEEEGKRCWTLNYEEFHMDILPCVPNDAYYMEPILTEIKLTHKLDDGKYIPKYSNPYRYHEWFEERMRVEVNEARKIFAELNNVEIDKIPVYKIKTPLQQAVQLLKRHRDIMYDKLAKERKDNAPISIIITTLAAHAYNNESNLYDALHNILNGMDKYIKKKGDDYVIENPVMPEENFAEKWKSEHNKVNEFYEWLRTAKQEILVEPMSVSGIQNVAEKLGECFGKNVVQRSLKEEGVLLKIARDNGKLYIDGLKGGLCTSPTETTKKVGGHTFFGE